MHFARFGRLSKGFGLRLNVVKTSFEVLKGNQNCAFVESEENRKGKTSPKKEKKKEIQQQGSPRGHRHEY